MKFQRFSAALLTALSLSACTGFTLGENRAGDDINLEFGSIGVDPRTETTFVLKRAEGRKSLMAIDPATGQVTTAADVTDLHNLRLSFPEDGVVVLGQKGGFDVIRRLDVGTYDLLDERQTDGRYNGTRLSPSGRYLAVADNNLPTAPIHLFDTRTLDNVVIPHDGEWLEAMWLHGSDELLAIVFYDIDEADARARIMRWSVQEVEAAGWSTNDDGFWANATLDITVENVTRDLLFSFTWVGISPDDRAAVFPVLSTVDESMTHTLLVLDLMGGDVRTVSDARGPVGFTPDSSTIVSYRYQELDGMALPRLLMVDAETLDQEVVELPYDETLPQFFVTREGSFVVIASVLGDEELVLYDIEQDQTTQMSGTGIALHEFVSRVGHGELWIASNGLHVLSFLTGAFESMAVSFTPRHINILPVRDLIVVDDAASDAIRFFDPEARSVTMTAGMPNNG